jgi:hypothetical protein
MSTDRPLESYPAAALAEFIRFRGVSYWPEEIDAAEQRAMVAKKPERTGEILGQAIEEALAAEPGRVLQLSPGLAKTIANCLQADSMGQDLERSDKNEERRRRKAEEQAQKDAEASYGKI